MSPLTLKKSRASKGSVSKVSLDRRRQERMCSGDALATPHFAQTGKTLLPWLKEQLLSTKGTQIELKLNLPIVPQSHRSYELDDDLKKYLCGGQIFKGTRSQIKRCTRFKHGSQHGEHPNKLPEIF
ncbi:hypothetical protein AVEN_14905-1 [Araneus ventricosus]|uniref:Uncharacterized protein n=1 Tax=Araneus ventricosus TaxID=182803 RepID=A0A4Y2M2X8_ARAVE|nr:hypothetical protein AVEN_14905-1 [Araneus ventricosus]